MMSHLQLKPGGRYEEKIRFDRAARLKELERRRAAQAAPSQVIMEELMLDGLEEKYGMSTGDKDSMPLRKIMSTLSTAIVAGKVVSFTMYQKYWQRYMAIETLRAYAVSHSQLRRARERSDMRWADLKAEVQDYYSAAHLRYSVVNNMTNADWDHSSQRLRKAAWQRKARPNDQSRRVGSRGKVGSELAYQNAHRIEVPEDLWAAVRA